MPVIDHPVHERVRISSDFRYGCHNRPHEFRKVVHGADCYGMKTWPFVMSNECKYDMSLEDGFCLGCQHQGSRQRRAA